MPRTEPSVAVIDKLDIDKLTKLAIARQEGANPVARAVCGITLALEEAVRDMQEEPPDAHERAVLRARITAEFNRLRTIPDEEWNRWCGVPKAEFLAAWEPPLLDEDGATCRTAT
jgi:hypothetical protein